MLGFIRQFAAELLPIDLSSPKTFYSATLDSQEHRARVDALRATAAAIEDENRLREFRDIAKLKSTDESHRLSSILSRAQSLFVTLAIFGALFSFGTAMLSSTAASAQKSSDIYFTLVVIIVAQMVLMVINISRAIAGMGYPTAGTSDLTSWLKESSTAGFFRAQALLELEHYRVASLNNTWRFRHLTNALKAFRNIVISISALILVIFLVGMKGTEASTSHGTSGVPANPSLISDGKAVKVGASGPVLYQILWWTYPADAWQAWFELGLLFVGIGGTLVVGWQSYLLRKQVNIGRAEFVATHRPKVTIAACKLTFEDVGADHMHHCAFTYRNEGSSPAFVREIGARVFKGSGPWTTGDREIQFDTPQSMSEEVLSGAERRYMTRTKSFNWDQKDEGNWYFAGYVTYSDAATAGATRRVGFLRRWNRDTMSWERELNEQYEYSY